MHELAVTESILEIANKHALQAQALRVTDIYLVIGRLSSIVDESVQFYWQMIAQNTLCQDSMLHFQIVPAQLTCLECQTVFEIIDRTTPCPNCGGYQLKISAGEEFYVDSIAIEK
jgi:hydrogenase nickel incorporation protein HypA/HybF